MPELSVILVSHNDRVHLDRCLRGLREESLPVETEIIVVDNSSSDGSPEMVRKLFPEITLLENEENVGFGKANNRGIAEASGEYLLFLNADTSVEAEALRCLLEGIRKRPGTGAVGPALLSGADAYQVSFGRTVDFFSEVFQKGFWNLYWPHRLKHDLTEREVGWLSAACLLVRRTALDEAGHFDEGFFLYFEDIDLCYRIRRKGWRLVFLPQAKVGHLGGTSTSTAKRFSRYHYRRSQLYFYRKHNSRTSLRLLRAYLWMRFALSLAFERGERGQGGPGPRELFQLLRG
jgi:GT2 family glycosyltransferase